MEHNQQIATQLGKNAVSIIIIIINRKQHN
jgi:hypothetical protein